MLKSLDTLVNYFNCYILVYCHHNHDIKCILSGKGAKAAMIYITDHITKMDVKIYEMLSLLSRAVSKMPEPSDNDSVKNRGKLLLQKCLTQFTHSTANPCATSSKVLKGIW